MGKKLFIIQICFFIFLFFAYGTAEEKKMDAPVAKKSKDVIIGKDEKGADIIKQFSENEECCIEVTVIKNATIAGEIAVVGSAMFTDLVLMTSENDVYVFRPQYTKQYWKYQGKVVTLKCRIEKRKVTDKKTGKIIRKYWLYPVKIYTK